MEVHSDGVSLLSSLRLNFFADLVGTLISSVSECPMSISDVYATFVKLERRRMNVVSTFERLCVSIGL